jgi:hypothetical protein
MLFYDDREQDESLKQYLVRGMEYTNMESGSVEAARTVADNAIEAIAKICTSLIDKELITEEELITVLRGYEK